MKSTLLVLALSCFLLFAGCAQSQPQGQPQPPASAPQAQAPPAAPPLPAQPQPNATADEPSAPPPVAKSASCSIQFQKDVSNIYYVMVIPAQAGISVSCPNGSDAQKQGELYFCAQLDAAGPTVAYINGVECGRAAFSQAGNSASPSKQSCTVLLSPSRISAGQTSAVTVKAYAPQEKSNLSYLCGDHEVSESAGGMVDTGKICQFNTPGTIEVYAKLNGEACASSTLTVFSTLKDCSVHDSAFAFDRGQYVYSARVSARGYSGTDELRYSCYDVPHAIKANTIPNTTDFVTTIECRSASGPLYKNVPVTMGGDGCGELELPA